MFTVTNASPQHTFIHNNDLLFTHTTANAKAQLPQTDTLELQIIKVAINKQTLNITNIYILSIHPTIRIPAKHRLPEHTRIFITLRGLQPSPSVRCYNAHDITCPTTKYTATRGTLTQQQLDTTNLLSNIDTPLRDRCVSQCTSTKATV